MLILKSANLSVPGIAHGFFGRRGGVSKGIYASLNCGPGSKDSRDDVMENRARATAALAPDAALVTLYQVHSAEAVTVTAPWAIAENPKADAMATDRPGIALGILTADCAPILLADPTARGIGAAHAGWNGALAGVVESALAAMCRLGAKPGRIRAAAGPCSSPEASDVGPEVQLRLVSADADHGRF